MGFEDRDRYDDRAEKYSSRDRYSERDEAPPRGRDRVDDRDGRDRRSRSRKRDSSPYDGPRKAHRGGSIMKVLCPYYNAGSLIGRGGEAIKEIKDKTGVQIDISKHDARFPGTEERVVTLQGDVAQIQDAVKFVQEKLRSDNEPASARSYDQELNEKRKKSCKLVVADSAMGKIIGKGGEKIKELKSAFNVQINTSKRDETPSELEERIISIEGEYKDIERCACEIIEDICADSRITMRQHVDYSDLNARQHVRRPDGKYSYRENDRDRGNDYERRDERSPRRDDRREPRDRLGYEPKRYERSPRRDYVEERRASPPPRRERPRYSRERDERRY